MSATTEPPFFGDLEPGARIPSAPPSTPTSPAKSATKTTPTKSKKKQVEEVVISLNHYSKDTFPYELYFSPNCEADIEKYSAKIESLKFQAKIDSMANIIENRRVHVKKLERQTEPLTAMLETLATKASELSAVHDSKNAKIGELEASIVTNGTGGMTQIEKLNARKAELEIAKLKSELLQSEIECIEADMVLESQKTEAEAALKEVQEARFALGKMEFDLIDLKDEYKKLNSAWSSKWQEEEEEEEVALSGKGELVSAMGDLEVAINKYTVLKAAAEADAEKIAALKAIEATLKEESTALEKEFQAIKSSETALKEANVNAINRSVALEKEVQDMKAAAATAEIQLKTINTGATQIAALSDEIETLRASEVIYKEHSVNVHSHMKTLEKEMEAWKSAAKAAENKIKIQEKEIDALKTVREAADTPKKVDQLKENDVPVNKIEIRKAADATHLLGDIAQSNKKGETGGENMVIIKAAMNGAPEHIAAMPKKIELMDTAEFTALIDSQITQIELLQKENAEFRDLVATLEREVADMKPLFIIGLKVRARHNMQQMRNRWPSQFGFHKDTFDEGYEAVNSGKAVADSTLYKESSKYLRDPSNFEEIYGVSAIMVWERRDFGIFIHILNMSVDMKVYSRGDYRIKSESFQDNFDMVLSRLAPHFQIASDEEFMKYPELVVAYESMCKERDGLYESQYRDRSVNVEKTWFEPAWIVREYDHKE